MFTNDCFEEHIVQFTEQIKNYGFQHISFEHARLTKVDAANNTIDVQMAADDGETKQLSYDVLVIATGGTYKQPWRAGADQCAFYEARK